MPELCHTKQNICRGWIYKIYKKDSLELYDNDGYIIGLVISQDTSSSNSDAIKIVYLDKNLGGIPNPTHIRIKVNNQQYDAICEFIQTVDISRFNKKIGEASETEMQRINQAITFGLGINAGHNPDGIFQKWEKYLTINQMFRMKYRSKEKQINRGEIYYITEDKNDPPIGSEIWSNRVGIIISNNGTNKNTNKSEIIYLSTSRRKRHSRTHVSVTSGTKQAIALCEHIYTIDKSQIKQKIGTITETEIQAINKAIMYSICTHGTRSSMPQQLFREWENVIHKRK